VTLDDVIGIYRHALSTAEASGPLNATAPNPVTNAEFTATLARVVGRPALVPVPSFGPKLLLGQLADELLFTSARVHPAATESSGYSFRHPTLEAALRHLLNRS
jgi:NAD dependent epimerase/dehydratase family enzyme